MGVDDRFGRVMVVVGGALAFFGLVALIMMAGITRSVRRTMMAGVEEDGDTVVSGEVLAKMAKELPDAAVSISTSDTQAVVKCARARYRLNTMPASDFPDFPTVEGTQSLTLDAKTLQVLADRSCRFVARDDFRPVIKGVHLLAHGGTTTVSATDSYRLTVATVRADGEFDAVIPADSLAQVAKVARDEVTISCSDNQVVMRSGSTTHVTRRIMGNFPATGALLPKERKTRVTFDAGDLREMLGRVCVTAVGGSVVVDASAESQAIRLRSSDPQAGESEDQMPADVEGETLGVALSAKFMADALGACDGETCLDMVGPTSPALFRSYGDVDVQALVMPVRM